MALKKFRIALSLAIASYSISQAYAAEYVQFDMPDANFTSPAGINSDGVVAGTWEDGSYKFHGFVRSAKGKLTSFDPPGSTYTLVRGINDQGTAIGAYQDSTSSYSFMRKQNGHIAVFSDMGIYGINNLGDVCGDAAGGAGAIRKADGTMIEFSVPDAQFSTIAYAINDADTVAGIYDTIHGFVRMADGTIENIDPPGSDYMFVFAINAAGAVTGSYREHDTGAWNGFIRDAAGQYTVYRPRNTEDFGTVAINDNGVLAGFYFLSTRDGLKAFERKRNGILVNLKPPGATSATASSLNNGGVIAGDFETATDGEWVHGYIRLP